MLVLKFIVHVCRCLNKPFSETNKAPVRTTGIFSVITMTLSEANETFSDVAETFSDTTKTLGGITRAFSEINGTLADANERVI